MRKGFTLVELLGVMIVISIILLITTPVVVGVIDKARREAFVNSTYGLISAGSLYYTEQLLEENLASTKMFEIKNGKWENSSKLSVNGQLPKDGIIMIDADGRVSISVFNGKYCAKKGYYDNEVTVVDDLDKDTCLNIDEIKIEYKEAILNGADPVLSTGMIPVIISSSGVVTVADKYREWYKYDSKQWANAVLVDEATRNSILDVNGVKESAVGTVIEESKILGYLVWIPRYEYKGLVASSAYSTTNLTSEVKTIDITFQGVETTTDDTHPAFDFGGVQLSGFWVGKFETSKATSGNEEIKDATQVRVLPHKISWRSINVYNIYYTVREMTTATSVPFGLNKNNSDPHLMKNTEWGAVAYLSHSIYGKNEELNVNNCDQYMTGIGGNNGYADAVDNCSTASLRNDSGWKSINGQGASTTGNVSGVYDMSGGSIEYVAGYNKTNSTDNNYSGFGVGQATTTSVEALPSRYFDSYNNTSDSYTVYTEGKRGDATVEMGPFGYSTYIDKLGATINSNKSYRSSWYGDNASFAQPAYPWFMRGGYHTALKPATNGIFSFSRSEGGASIARSFRIAIAPVAQL